MIEIHLLQSYSSQGTHTASLNSHARYSKWQKNQEKWPNFRSHITPSLIKLHWLPVKARLKYKCAVLCYKCVHCIAPPYLCNMLKMYIPTRNLRSKSKLQLCTKNPNYVRLGGRAFSTHGPSFWNSLPYELRSITTITRFKVELKTYLFKNSYNV